jgi:hypothetical protein
LIEKSADDDRNFVKKAVNMALRARGKRNRKPVAAPVRLSAASIEIGPPAPQFTVSHLVEVDYNIMPTARTFDVSPDGRRFLVARCRADPNTPPKHLIVNWLALMNA